MLLTLDLASNVGWTLGAPADKRFKYESVRFSGVQLACQFARWLDQTLLEVDLCVFEAPILPRHTSAPAIRLLHGMAWHVELVCSDQRIECWEVSPTSVKKFVAGSGRADKLEVMREVRRRGYDVANHDAADAVALRLYVLHERFPELRDRFRLGMGTLGATGG